MYPFVSVRVPELRRIHVGKSFFFRMVKIFSRGGCRELLLSLRRATVKRQLHDPRGFAVAADVERQRCADPSERRFDESHCQAPLQGRREGTGGDRADRAKSVEHGRSLASDSFSFEPKSYPRLPRVPLPAAERFPTDEIALVELDGPARQGGVGVDRL